MTTCEQCKARMVYRDDSRVVCLACGWSRDDTIEEELAVVAAGNLPLHVGSPVATERAMQQERATWHSGLAETEDDGFRYGFHGERHSRRLIGGEE